MKIESPFINAELKCSLSWQGWTIILPEKMFYVYIAKVTDKQIEISKFLIVESMANAPMCMSHEKDDEPYMLQGKGEILIKCDNLSTNLTITAIFCKAPKHSDEKVDQL